MSSTTTHTTKKMVILKTSDGQIFEVDEVVAQQSQSIKHMIEDDCISTAIPLPNVTSNILSKVIEYCNRHVNNTDSETKIDDKELNTFDTKFINVDQATLYDLIMAANYLEIKNLLDLACQRVADMIKGKKPEEIRTIFNIENDFTPEEEEVIRKENAWAFE